MSGTARYIVAVMTGTDGEPPEAYYLPGPDGAFESTVATEAHGPTTRSTAVRQRHCWRTSLDPGSKLTGCGSRGSRSSSWAPSRVPP
jgi:hypothetical protein